MNTDKTNFWCKKPYKACTHHALLLTLALQCSHKHSDNPSSSAHFMSGGSQDVHRMQLKAARTTLAIFRARRQIPCCSATCLCLSGRQGHEEHKFCRHPIIKKEKKNCQGLAKKDGLIQERWTDTNNELPANLTSLPLVQKSSSLG